MASADYIQTIIRRLLNTYGAEDGTPLLSAS